MPAAKLDNYLRVYRKRAGLSQEELSFLLGWNGAAHVSRYEKRRRKPGIGVAFECQRALGIPVSELFAGLCDKAERRVNSRLLELHSRLQAEAASSKPSRALQRKLEWVSERVGEPQLTNPSYEPGTSR